VGDDRGVAFAAVSLRAYLVDETKTTKPNLLTA